MGIGAGGTGGGGGPSSASLGPISVKGTLTGANEPLLLTSSVAAEMVYPLPVSVVAKLRQNRMVVSAGSMGGGGLNIYGALEACGKIYTIFLPMPGANWTMQFCQKSDASTPAKPQTQARVIQLESPMVPPDPDSDSRFDFKRLPLPPEKGTNKTIVLKGVLGEDGTVAKPGGVPGRPSGNGPSGPVGVRPLEVQACDASGQTSQRRDSCGHPLGSPRREHQRYAITTTAFCNDYRLCNHDSNKASFGRLVFASRTTSALRNSSLSRATLWRQCAHNWQPTSCLRSRLESQRIDTRKCTEKKPLTFR